MCGWILNVAYAVLLTALSPVLLWKRLRYGKYRGGWQEKLWGRLPSSDSAAPLVWMHGVSVGEVLLLRNLVSELHRRRPDVKVLVSTTSATGFRVLREKIPDCCHAYFPLDFTWSVNTALQRVQPDLVVLAELELWPNFLSALARREIPTVIVNARLSERSYRGYRHLRWLLGPWLASLSGVAAQTPEYAGRFASLGVPQIRIRLTGSIKFDGVQTDRKNPATRRLRAEFGLKPDDRVLVAGSTQELEEGLVLEVYRVLRDEFPDLRLIIVPRHPERGDAVADRIQRAGFCVRRRSQSQPAPAVDDRTDSVGLLDTIGELGACWGLADLALVGGSFTRRGGQNMIEPAAYGAAVCFGPSTRNFRQVVEMLLQADAARVVRNKAELTSFLQEMLRDPDRAHRMGRRARELVLAQAGATGRTVDLLLDLLPETHQSLSRSA